MTEYDARIVVKYNKNLHMSPGKIAAQAVHAALSLYGVHPGEDSAVVVLSANKGPVEAMDAVIRDAGKTEVKPGSTTAGASFDFSAEDEDHTAKWERVKQLSKAMNSLKVEYEKAFDEWWDEFMDYTEPLEE